MDIQQVTYNPSTMCGVKTNEYTIQGKNAEDVVTIMKGMQPSGAAQVINALLGAASTAFLCWVSYKAVKSLTDINEEMKKEENK
jgi:hypothetical protein